MRLSAGLILAALLAACGNGVGGNDTANGGTRAHLVADRFNRDCLSAETQAPDEAMRAHLRRLCSCGRARIETTPIGMTESEASINDKVHAAANACYAELGGAPGEGRR